MNPIFGNPGMIHSLPTAFIDECSGYGMDHAWVTEDEMNPSCTCMLPGTLCLIPAQLYFPTKVKYSAIHTILNILVNQESTTGKLGVNFQLTA